MSSEQKVTPNVQAPVVPAAGAGKVVDKGDDSGIFGLLLAGLDKVLALLSSVRFGVTMLGIVLLCCMIGMIIMQVNVEGFQKYYQQISPAQRTVFGALLFFDIYRAWYFTLLLAITGLNIILASIDRFPAAWQYVVKPKLTASPKFIAAQTFNSNAEERGTPESIAERVRTAWKAHGFKAKITGDEKRITVFAQRNVWNRLGAYAVHVALLTIFVGGFITSRLGVGGSMEIRPGKSSNTFSTVEFGVGGAVPRQVSLPEGMAIECRDIQQKLIRPEGGLDAQNTIDWLSYITVVDKGARRDMLVHLNNVGDYRGYRFFQSQFQALGNAREITLRFDPASGGAPRTVKIPRDGSADVEGIGHVEYSDFLPDFEIGSNGPENASPDYNNPVALLTIKTPDGNTRRAYAFKDQAQAQSLTDKIAKSMGQAEADKAMLVAGNRISLTDFEKVSTGHTLTIQYDPGRTPVYLGFILLVLALCSVFFFSHQRMWAVVERGGKGSSIYFGGNTNRNRPAFEARFNSLVQSVTGGESKHE
jgi:cytochrome c biogenesis protein